MTNITKAAQQALAALETCRIRSVTEWEVTDVTPKNVTLAIDALRAALQDKAVEVRDARFWLEAIVDIWSDCDKAPEHRCYVEGAFSDAMREASALLAAQPAPVVPDDVVRYRTIRDGLVYIEPHESGEIYVAGETGVYTKSGDEFDAAIDAIAASQKNG